MKSLNSIIVLNIGTNIVWAANHVTLFGDRLGGYLDDFVMFSRTITCRPIEISLYGIVCEVNHATFLTNAVIVIPMK